MIPRKKWSETPLSFDRRSTVSTDEQDVAAEPQALLKLGVARDHIYVDEGLTGTTRDRPGLREALAACRAGDTLVVTKTRPSRPIDRDAHAIADELAEPSHRARARPVGLRPDPRAGHLIGRLLLNVLAMIAEFEADLIRARTREGMKIAKATTSSTGPPGTNPGRKSISDAICSAILARREIAGSPRSRGCCRGRPPRGREATRRRDQRPTVICRFGRAALARTDRPTAAPRGRRMSSS